MNREQYLTFMIRKRGTLKAFADSIDMPYSTLQSILKNTGGASIDNIFKICAGLGITTNDLNKYAEFSNEDIEITPKDEKHIAKILESMLDDVESGITFAATGGTVEEEVEKELFKKSLKEALIFAKKKAKEKYTPKKYRK